MPFDSSGNYTLPPGYEAITGQTIQPSQHNPPLQDIGSALSSTLIRDGRAAMSAPLNMGGNRVTNASPGINPSDLATVSQLGSGGGGGGGNVPAGAIMWGAWQPNEIPGGWLHCDGSIVPRTSYAALFQAIGTRFGAGDGSTTFAIPDLRGRFVRGLDSGAGRDPSRTFGSVQAAAFPEHSHTAFAASSGAHTHDITVSSGGQHTHEGSTDTRGDHSHGISLSAAGDHTHSTTVSTTGSHSHGMSSYSRIDQYAYDFGAHRLYAAYFPSSGGNAPSTDSAGSHTHSVSISSAGSHTHTGSSTTTGNHFHTVRISSSGSHGHTGTAASAGGHTHTISIGNAGSGTESRPVNIALTPIIKT